MPDISQRLWENVPMQYHLIPVRATAHSQDPTWTEDLSLCVVKGCEATLKPLQDHFLHPQEKKRYETMDYSRRRQSYLLGRYAAKGALGAFDSSKTPSQIWIQTGLLGEPFVEGKTNALSIAHTGECGIAIAGSGRIALGIDIEPVTRFRSLKTDILCGEEHRLIAAFGGEDDNTQGIFWTAKEALAKCVGTGLSTPLCVFEVGHVERWGPMTSLRFRNFPAFQGYVWQNGSFFVALCLRCAEVTSVSQMA